MLILFTITCISVILAVIVLFKYQKACQQLLVKERAIKIHRWFESGVTEDLNNLMKLYKDAVINLNNKSSQSSDLYKKYPITTKLLYIYDHHCMKCSTNQDIFNIKPNDPDNKFSIKHNRVKTMSNHEPVIINIDYSIPVAKPKYYKIDDKLKIEVTNGSADNDGLTAKCSRCKRYRSECMSNYDSLCDRCVQALIADFPDHESVPHIKANICQQQARWLKHN